MSTAIDERVELDVDIDATVPCAAPDCENPAAWLLVPGCRHSLPTCEGHREIVDRAILVAELFMCLERCLTASKDIDWRPM